MKTVLNAAFAAAGAAEWGAVPIETILAFLPDSAMLEITRICPNPKTVLVAAFPYFAGDAPGNLSLYARGEDYHSVLTARLNAVSHNLREEYPEETFFAAADNSPLPEQQIAWLVGLGLRGRNGLLILPPFGSYVFLGTILTSAAIPCQACVPAPDCCACGKCIAACPTGALGMSGFDASRCLSHLTQKKGQLSGEETVLVAAHEKIWGCDICQSVCPHNSRAELSQLPEFRNNLMHHLSTCDLEGLTNRTFQARYGARAFAWRGPAVLRRNLDLKQE